MEEDQFHTFKYLLKENIEKTGYEEYLEFVWDALQEDGDEFEIDMELTSSFREHLPVESETYLESLCSCLKSSDTITLNDKEITYLAVFIYYHMASATEDYNEASLLAIRLLFNICMRETHNLCLNYVQYNKLLEMSGNMLSPENSNVGLLNDLCEFLAIGKIPWDSFKIFILFLSDIILSEDSKLHDSFDVREGKTITHYAFQCLLAITCNPNITDQDSKNLVATMILSLTRSYRQGVENKYNINILHANVFNFIQLLTQTYDIEWIVSVFLVIGRYHYESLHYIDFINHMTIEFYNKYVTTITHQFQESDCKSEDDNLIYNLICRPHIQFPYSMKIYLIRAQLLNLVLLIKGEGENKQFIDFAMERLTKYILCEHVLFKMILKDLFVKSEEAPRLFTKLFESAHGHANLNWVNKNVNKQFLKLMWNLYLKEPNIFTTAQIRDMIELCHNGSINDIRDVVLILKTVIIEKFAADNQLAVILFGILIKHTLTTGISSKYFAQLVYSLTFGRLTQSTAESDQAFQLIERLHDTKYNYIGVINKFIITNLIKETTIDFLFENYIFRREGSWPITILIVQLLGYEKCIPNTVAAFLYRPYEEIFSYPELYFVFSFIYLVISKNNILCKEECIKVHLSKIIKIGYEEMKFDQQTLGVVLKLIEVIFVLPPSDIGWVRANNKVWSAMLVENFKGYNQFGIIMNSQLLAYVSELCFSGGFEIKGSLFEMLEKYVQPVNITQFYNMPDIWCNLIMFYSKIGLIHEKLTDDLLEILEYSISSGPPQVKISCLAAFRDICIMRKLDLNIYTKRLYQILNSNEDDNTVKINAMERLIIFLNENHMHVLEYEDIAQLLTGLMGFGSDMLTYFFIEFKVKIMSKYEQAFAKNFIQFMIDINKIKIVVNKLQLFNVMFNTFSNYICLCLLDKMALEIMEPMINQRFSYTNANSLLADCVNLIIIQAVKEFDVNIRGDKIGEFFEKILSDIKRDFGKASFTTQKLELPEEYNTKLKNILNALFKVMYKIESKCKPLISDVFLALITFISTYYGSISVVVMEGINIFKPHLDMLEPFYLEHKMDIRYISEGVNIDNWRNDV